MTLRPQDLGADDARAVTAAGVAPQALEDAIVICFGFNLIDRLADSLGFDVPDAAGFAQQAQFLLKNGYTLKS